MMLKRASHIILIIILLVATSGLAVTRHYCGTSLMSFSFFSTPKPCCDNGCDKCHNENSFNKLTDEFTDAGFHGLDLKNIVQPVHDLSVGEFSPQILLVSQPQVFNILKFLSYKTGGAPAWLSNFRC